MRLGVEPNSVSTKAIFLFSLMYLDYLKRYRAATAQSAIALRRFARNRSDLLARADLVIWRAVLADQFLTFRLKSIKILTLSSRSTFAESLNWITQYWTPIPCRCMLMLSQTREEPWTTVLALEKGQFAIFVAQVSIKELSTMVTNIFQRARNIMLGCWVRDSGLYIDLHWTICLLSYAFMAILLIHYRYKFKHDFEMEIELPKLQWGND